MDVITEDVFIRMDDLNFVFMLVLPFGALFNLPLVLIVLAKLDFITSAMLAKKRKYIILLAFIAAAVITRRQTSWAVPPGPAHDRPPGNQPPHHPLWPASVRVRG